MTTKEIQSELDQQTAIHQAALQIVQLIDAAVAAVGKLGGDGDAARDRIIELVTSD